MKGGDRQLSALADFAADCVCRLADRVADKKQIGKMSFLKPSPGAESANRQNRQNRQSAVIRPKLGFLSLSLISMISRLSLQGTRFAFLLVESLTQGD